MFILNKEDVQNFISCRHKAPKYHGMALVGEMCLKVQT